MIQVIEYEHSETSIKTGFKKHNFVVYGEMGIIEGFTKEQHLQRLYEQCKSAIDYETERYNQGLQNSIVTELEGEEFIPDEPKLRTLRLSLDKEYVEFKEGQENTDIYLFIAAKDQYGEDIDVEVDITSSLGEVEDNILTIPEVSEYTEVEVIATSSSVSDVKTISVYPYSESSPTELDLLRNELDYVQSELILLKDEDMLTKLKSDTLIDRQDFLEDVITEMILTVVP